MRGRIVVAICAGVFLASRAAHALPSCPTVTQKKWPELADAKTDLLAVSNHERLSMGVLQWNWTTGSLQRQLLKTLSDAVFDSAPSGIRDGFARDCSRRAGRGTHHQRLDDAQETKLCQRTRSVAKKDCIRLPA